MKAEHLFSRTIQLYPEWVAAASHGDAKFVDKAYAFAEEHYDAGGDTIVETYGPSDVLELRTMAEVKRTIGYHVEAALNARWGEDSDPELATYRKWHAIAKKNPNPAPAPCGFPVPLDVATSFDWQGNFYTISWEDHRFIRNFIGKLWNHDKVLDAAKALGYSFRQEAGIIHIFKE